MLRKLYFPDSLVSFARQTMMVLGLALTTMVPSFAQSLGTYVFTGTGLVATRNAASSVNANVTFGAFTNNTLTDGSQANEASYTAWGTGTTINTAKYVEFSISPNASVTLNLSSLTFTARRSGTGPQTLVVRSSNDAFASNLTFTAGAGAPGNGSAVAQTVDLSSLTGLTTAISFRIYAFNPATANSGTGNIRLDGISINGSAISATPSITLTGSSFLFDATTTAEGTSQPFTISGNNLTGFPGDVTLTAPTGYEVSKDNNTFASSVTYPFTSATLSSATFHVRLGTGAAATSVTGNVSATGGTATSNNIAVSGTRAGAFTNGNIVVLRAGNGTDALGNPGNQMAITEFAATAPGAPVNILTIPVTGTKALVQSNTATSEGALSRSPDGTKIVFAAYRQSLPNITSLASTGASTVNRAIASVVNSGQLEIPVSSSTAFDAGNPRAAATLGSRYVASGQATTATLSGLRGGNTSGTQLTPTVTNARNVRFVNGRLVLTTNSTTSDGSLAIGLISTGMGYDVASTNQTSYQVATPTVGSPDQYDFSISPDGKTIYVTDNRTVGTTNASGGVQRWDFNQTSGVYEFVRTFPTSATGTGSRHLVVEFGAGTNTIYATSGEIAGNNKLIKITDDGTASAAYATMVTSGKVVELATAGTNFLFRGIDFAPVATKNKAIVLTTNGQAGSVGSFVNTAVGDGNFGSSFFGVSTIKTFYVSGYGLNATGLTATLANVVGSGRFSFRIGGSGAFSAGPLSIPSSSYDADGNLAATRIDVRFVPNTPEINSQATITLSGGGASSSQISVSGTGSTPFNYYLRNTISDGSSVDLTDLSNWTRDITGVAVNPPASLSSAGQIFNVNKNVTAITNNFVVTGTSSEIRVSDSKTLTTSASVIGAVTITGTGTINITDAGTSLSYNSLSTTSTIGYTASGAQTIPTGTYGGLTLGGTGAKTLSDATNVTGVLTFGATTTVSCPASATTVFLNGGVTAETGVSYATNWTTNGTLRFNGSLDQSISGPGTVRAANILILDKIVGQVNVRTSVVVGTLSANLNGNASLKDNGNSITITNNLQLNGTAGGYILTGTVVMAGATGTQQIRNLNGFDQVIVAEFNNLTLNQSGAAAVNFMPATGTSTITIKGNLTVNHTSSGAVNLNSNYFKIGGSLVLTAGTFSPSATSTLEFYTNTNGGITGSSLTMGSLILNKGFGTFAILPTLNVRGNLTRNSGIIDLTSTSLTLGGSTSQTLVGGFEPLNLEVNNVAGATLSAGSVINVLRELKLNANNTLTLTGATLRLKSSTTRTAYLAPVPSGASIVGNITAERSLSNPSASGWYFLSSPIKGATLANIHSQVAQKGFTGVPAGNPSVYFLNETVATNSGWVVPTNVTNSIVGTGFRAYATSVALFGIGNKLTFTGAPVIGNGVDNINTGGSEAFAYSMTNTTTGYNMVGNPFAAPVLWDNSAAWTKTNLSPTIFTWDVVAASYKTWNSNTTSGTATSGVIPSFSAFIVQPVDPGAVGLTMTEAAKTSTTNLWVARKGAELNTLRLKLDNGNTFNDEAILALDQNGSRSMTINDARKLYGGTLDLALVVDGNEFATKYVNDQLANQVVDLKVKSYTVGSHTLHLSGLSTMAPGLSISLRDNVLGTVTSLSNDLDYNFTVTNAATSATNRFSLIIGNSVTSLGGTFGTISTTLYPNPSNGQAVSLQVTGATSGQDVLVSITDAAGRVISNAKYVAAGVQDAFRLPENLTSGIYLVNTSVAGTKSIHKLVIR